MTSGARADGGYLAPLTALRGIACIAVLFGHVVQTLRYSDPPGGGIGATVAMLIRSSFNAQAAVLMFFVLSGCVLALSLRGTSRFTARSLAAFYIRRGFRIYPLLWVSTAVAILSMRTSRGLAVSGILVDWLTRNLESPITLGHMLASLAGAYTRYNGPMWSLRVELAYSALFPAIFLLTRPGKTRWATLLGLAVLALLPFPHQLGLGFALSFALGAVIPTMSPRFGILGGRVALLAVLVLLYERIGLAPVRPPERFLDIIDTLASVIIVRHVYASGAQYEFLSRRLVGWLGDRSYSIYLLHLPLMLIILSGAQAWVAPRDLLSYPARAQLCLGAATAIVTILISAVTYRFIELPLHRVGRGLARRISAPSARSP